MRSAPPERGPAAVLALTSGGAAVVVALANVASLALARDVARLRDLRPLVALRVALDAHDVRLLSALPDIVSAPFELHATLALGGFAALAVAIYLACAWSVAAVTAPLVLPLARRRAPADARCPPSFPLGVLAAYLVPIAAHRLGLWTTLPSPLIAVASIAIATAGWWLASRVLRTRGAARLVVAVSAFLTMAGGTLVLLGTPLAVAATRPTDARPTARAGAPNVVLISIDTLRPDHLGSYGYRRDTSPAIDALAAAGARFTTAISPTSWTLPAHATLLTALPPEIHGVTEDRFRLGGGIVTLAQVLRHQGYATAGFISGPYLDAGYGFARGFDLYDDYSALRVSIPAVERARTSPALLAAAAAWLGGGRPPTRPFFLFVHMWDVHYDYNPPAPFDTMFDPDYRGAVTGENVETGTAVHAGMDPRDLAHVVALYDGEIRYTDGYVQRLVDAVARTAPVADTILVIASDHGEEFYEHGDKGHHKALYDESIRVPLIIRYPPRIAPGTVVDAQVRLVDVAPTILALAGIAPPPSFGVPPAAIAYAGRDLTPLLSPTTAAPFPTLTAYASLQPHAQTAVRTQTHKLLTNPFKLPREQLFDLQTDPTEQTNLATTNPETAASLRNDLTIWEHAAKSAAQSTNAAAVSDEHKAALRALGYIE